jgi:hypothetical protein
MSKPPDETPRDLDDWGTYYILATVNRWTFSLPIDEGDRIVTELEAMRDNVWATTREAGDPMFIRFTDRSGSEVRIRAAQIECMYLSTAESRARDKEFEAREKANKDWSQDE